ncbi:hypothetical protein EJB05_02025 [Eragrostis curvula]|uniref:Uncharacterized protein n=1 Tax=Eragrostis curvula TaxID=38414 RepID=A0A5J9WRS7_9POAL|nr:hypothetical protein EJB05_02025 [Eragrostis curvula]
MYMEGTTIKGDLLAEDMLMMRSSPFQKEKHVTMEQQSDGVESTWSQCYISVEKEMHRTAEVVRSDTFEDSQDPFDVDNKVGPQVVGFGTVVEVVGIKSPSKERSQRLQEL